MDYCIHDRYEQCFHDCTGCPKAENKQKHDYFRDYLFSLYRERTAEDEQKYKS